MAKKFLRVGLVVLLLVGTWGAGAYLGYRAGRAEAFQEFVGIEHLPARRSHAIRYALGLRDFQGVAGQDLWVMYRVHPGVTDGFFVDLGSADGIANSTTWALERSGWTGICIDPFPRNMESRTCQVFAEAVDNVGGRTVQFQNPGSESGGFLKYAGWWVSQQDKENVVEVKTTTLRDILRRGNAPSYIHYLNVDIEGAEYMALSEFPFDEYKFGAITIEHNNMEDQRAKIRELLVKNGYRLEFAILDQDWYVRADKPNGGSATQ
ncbi:MAG TPA: FkbM family methyltransferase [Xanthobacteraceae bacterium]|nr:FkbM family methyltransferase [Xanthobacteraceae bacterium]